MELVKLSNSEVRTLFKEEEDEVVLGRGPILEIADVKLSRKVAKIRRMNNGEDKFVLLRAANKPVFVSTEADDYDMREVRQEDEVELHEGQRIALAPGRTEHVYTVRLIGSSVQEEVKGEKEKNPVKATPTKNGKRTLPAWMMDNAEQEEEETKKTPARRKDDKLPIKRSSPKATPSPKSPSPSTPKKTKKASPAPSPRRSPVPKRLHAMSDDEDGDAEEDKSPKSSPASKKRKVASRSPKSSPDKKPAGAHYISGSDDEEEVKKPSNKKKFPVLVTKEDFESDDEEEQDDLEKDLKATANKNTEEPKRKCCAYGASCYRKNPQHRLEEAHPGDDDYKSDDDEDDDVDDKRPECEYGVNCYRKNPQHRKDYKHTAKPNPKRRAKTKAANKKKNKSDYDSGDEDDDSTKTLSSTTRVWQTSPMTRSARRSGCQLTTTIEDLAPILLY